MPPIAPIPMPALRAIVLALVAAVATVSAFAQAQPQELLGVAREDDAGDFPSSPQAEMDSSYDSALRNAVDAHAHGDLVRAQREMETAHALKPSARTLRGLGVIAFEQRASQHAARRLRASLDDPRLPLTPPLRRSVEGLLRECEAEFARVRAKILPIDAELRIDDEVASAEPSGEYWVASGTHRIEVSAKGYVPHRVSEVFEAGAVHILHVALEAIPVSKPAPGRSLATGAISPPRLRVQSTRWRRAKWGLLGAGAGAASAALGSWLAVWRRFGDLKDECRTGCSTQQVRDRWDAERIDPLRRSALGLAVAGVAMLATSGGMLAWELGHEQRRASLALTPVGLELSFRH